MDMSVEILEGNFTECHPIGVQESNHPSEDHLNPRMTKCIVKNFADPIIRSSIGKDWTTVSNEIPTFSQCTTLTPIHQVETVAHKPSKFISGPRMDYRG